ncbi:MAG: TetR/AcrR family transcriptional regulator [Mycobacterium sp.]|nr:TetR/AcrR family transcriptional regulator [Mycobacterium sp.]
MAPELIAAALQAAEAAGCDVADVPVAVIAATAGISRSTLWRRLGGARDVLDNAVRAVGVDPGGKPPVRVRAIAAAAELIGASGLSATTLEAVAKRAGCSVYSLHAAFGGRDALITAVFEHDSPIREIEDYLCGEQDDFREKVRGFLATVATAFGRSPHIAPAIFAEIFARPDSPAVRNFTAYSAPRVVGILTRWLDREIQAGRILDLPRPLLAQQLLGPITLHVLTRPAAPDVPAYPRTDIDTVCDIFTDAFIKSVGTGTPAGQQVRS